MPFLRKKSSKKINAENGNDNLIGDVTIDDFANSSRTHARFRKAVTNLSSEVIFSIRFNQLFVVPFLFGRMNLIHTAVYDISYCIMSYFLGFFSFFLFFTVKQKATVQEEDWKEEMDESDQNLSDANKSKKNSKGVSTSQRRSRKTSSSEKNVIEDEGVDYPLDIWFIISEYISPEAVGKFARICRSSYHVTTTGKFWFHLYKSYYKFVPSLPERLQPQCMVRTHGLRACVIRTLHYTYFALKREVDDVSYLRQDEPHSLVKRRCCLMWHKKGKMRWYFYFKLKEIPKSINSLKQKSKINVKKTDFLEMLEDVAVNPEEGCKVLRVTCLKYSMLPPVIGLILQSVSMTLMPGFKDHRLQLGFGTSDIPGTLTNQVILNDVVNCQILDWWHPLYPHQDGITTIELPQSDLWE